MITQTCIPLLKQKNKSSIVFTLDDKNTAYWGAYGVSKAAVTAFMKILADELENTSINVTGLIPGNVKTAMRTRAFPAEDTSALNKPEDVATALAYLLSEDSQVINEKPSHGKIFQLDELAL